MESRAPISRRDRAVAAFGICSGGGESCSMVAAIAGSRPGSGNHRDHSAGGIQVAGGAAPIAASLGHLISAHARVSPRCASDTAQEVPWSRLRAKLIA